MRAKQSYTLVIGAFLLLSVSNVMAQFSAGAELGFPMGNFSNVASAGFGISGRYEASIKDKLNWTASVGFLSFGGKAFLGGTFGNVSVIPLVGGIKYYFNTANDGFYATADLGLNVINYSVAYPNSGNGNGVTFASASTTRLGLAPGVGYRMGNWDFTGRFNLVSDFNYFGLRAAYIFSDH